MGLLAEIIVEYFTFPIKDKYGIIVEIAGGIITINHLKFHELELENKKIYFVRLWTVYKMRFFIKIQIVDLLVIIKLVKITIKKQANTDIIGNSDLDIYGDKIIAENFIKQDQEVMQRKQ